MSKQKGIIKTMLKEIKLVIYNNVDKLLTTLFLVSVWGIIVIGFNLDCLKVVSCIPVKYINPLNNLIFNLSCSYIAAYIFYFLSEILPRKKNERIMKEAICLKMEIIGYILTCILRRFADGTNLSTTDFSFQNIKNIFIQKNWFDIDREYLFFKIQKTCLQACVIDNQLLCKEIESFMFVYKEYLNTESLLLLERMRNSRFIKNASTFALLDKRIINESAKEGLAEEFYKIVCFYNQVKNLI